MGFKSRIFGDTLILCVLLILDTRNIVNGCQLFKPDGEEVNLNEPYVTVGLRAISDNEPPGLLYNLSTVGVTSVVQAPGQENKYLVHTFNDPVLNILLSEDYKDWKKIEGVSFRYPYVVLQLDCTSTLVEFRTQISNFTNLYPPEFPQSSYNITLPMPLPAGYTIVGDCGVLIDVTDYDYHNDYTSDISLSLKDPRADLVVTAGERVGKKWPVILKTTNTFRIEEPLTITLVAKDVPPAGKTDPSFTSEMSITIEPNIAASTPASPLFGEPIYILEIKEEENIQPIKAILVEGATADYEVQLVHSRGEDLTEFFDTDIEGAVVTLTPNMSLASTEFSDNFGVLILEAKHPNTNRIGKTAILVILPGNYVTPPPTSTTETTMLPCSCPTEETTYTADTTKTTEEITQCPEVTSPIEVTCSEVTSTTEPTTLSCTCPTEETTFISDATKPSEESTFVTDTTKSTEETTFNSDTTTSTEESTQCPVVTCAPETTVVSCTCPPPPYCPTEETPTTSPSTSDTDSTTTTTANTNTCEPCDCTPWTPESSTGTTESCVCTTEQTSVPDTDSTTTTTANTNTCEPCDCTPWTPESSTAPPQERSIYFTDPQAIVYIYPQQMGYIKTMSAFCIPECKIKYDILDGPLSSSLVIDSETGDVNVTEHIKEGGLFDVKAIAEIDGKNIEKTATVHLSMMTLQPCQNGSYWTNALTVSHVQEEFESSLTVEKCDLMDGCKCAIVKVIPEKARDYFSDGEVVVLNKPIDREDTDLFPDQSNTYIILQLERSCESDENTSYKFWDKRSRSVIDDIGTIEYDPLRTVNVLQIQDINDNRPQFDVTSLTVGYPNAEIVHQLLPPYLMKVQATDADFGENAVIKYSLVPDDKFFIHQDTGVIYPVPEAFRYEDTQFTVYASDSQGAGKPLEVKVTILSSDNLLVIKQRGSVLEDVNAVIDKISSITSYSIKLLSAAVIANDTANQKDDDRQLSNLISMKESSNPLLQLIIYGLDLQEKPVSYSDIQKDLEGATEFASESWTDSNSCATSETTSESPSETTSNQSSDSDTGLLVAVIVLAVIILVLLGGAGVAYLHYVRSRRNNNDDYYDKILNSSKSSISGVDENAVSHAIEKKDGYANEELSNETEVIQPSAPLSPHLSTTKPEQELIDMIEPNEFNQETTDVKNAANNGDGDEHQDEENSENIVKRRKSIVTFNDNIERIEIEEV